MITMIGVGIERPDPVVQATVKTGFATAFASVTNIIFAYAGHVAFFSFISELKDPRDFPRALYVLQVCDTTLYIIVAIVVYRYAGTDVASPALGSTGTIVKKVAYGMALPTVSIIVILTLVGSLKGPIRSSSPASYTPMSQPSTSMSASSVGRSTCRSAHGWPSAPGSASP